MFVLCYQMFIEIEILLQLFGFLKYLSRICGPHLWLYLHETCYILASQCLFRYQFCNSLYFMCRQIFAILQGQLFSKFHLYYTSGVGY